VAFDKKWMEKGSSNNVNVKFTAGTSKVIAESKVVAGSKPQVGSKVVVQPPKSQVAAEANKYGYRNNYKGKNPMTRTQ
jgi:type IV secretory pathway protease TraF